MKNNFYKIICGLARGREEYKEFNFIILELFSSLFSGEVPEVNSSFEKLERNFLSFPKEIVSLLKRGKQKKVIYLLEENEFPCNPLQGSVQTNLSKEDSFLEENYPGIIDLLDDINWDLEDPEHDNAF